MINILVVLVILTILYFSIKPMIKNKKEKSDSCCGCSMKNTCNKKDCD